MLAVLDSCQSLGPAALPRVLLWADLRRGSADLGLQPLWTQHPGRRGVAWLLQPGHRGPYHPDHPLGCHQMDQPAAVARLLLAIPER